MRVRGRLDRLRQALGGLSPPGQLDLVVAVPVWCGMADGLTQGVHFNEDAAYLADGAGLDSVSVPPAPSGSPAAARPGPFRPRVIACTSAANS